MRQQAGNIRGQGFVNAVQQAIEGFGETITLPDGSRASASVTSLDMRRAADWIPQGILNAGNADPLLIDVPASYLTNPAVEGKQVTRQGTLYTITRIVTEVLSDQIAIRRLGVYRTPSPDSATADPMTGLREDFRPPASTH